MASLSVDLGASSAVAVLLWPGGRVQPLLFDGSPTLPAADPAAALHRIAAEATLIAGPPTGLVVIHPVGIGPAELSQLVAAAVTAGLPQPVLVSAPVAAATYFTGPGRPQLRLGGQVLVYDLSDAGFHASVLRWTGVGFEILAHQGFRLTVEPDTEPTPDRTIQVSGAVIQAAGLLPQHLTAIFLTGTASRHPRVSSLLNTAFGLTPVAGPDTLVAEGAAGLLPPPQPPFGPPPGYPPIPYGPPPPQPGRRWVPILIGVLVVVALGIGATVQLLSNDGSAAISAGTPTTTRTRSAPVETPPTGPTPGATTGPTPGSTLVIGVDLPFTGHSADASIETWNAVSLYLDQVNGRAGQFRIALRRYDNATAAKGTWDEATCARNATLHVNNAAEVAVLGTYNSGCSKIEAPILNQDPAGPMLMVSHANTNPGLTMAWEAAEPGKYHPTGKRNFARVVGTDDLQGPAAARFAAADLKVRKCFVLNDDSAYGANVAKAFVASAPGQGLQVVGEATWDPAASTYTALFDRAKSAGADCVFLGGLFDNNGARLVRDKVQVLGDNTKVKLLTGDGFSGYPAFNALPEAAGAYLTYATAPSEYLLSLGGESKRFLDAYRAKYGAYPRSGYALYGVQALQTILAAIENSDGSRAGVRDAVFEGDGLTISASKAVLGRDVRIDPATGDVNLREVTVEVIKNRQEAFHKVIAVP